MLSTHSWTLVSALRALAGHIRLYSFICHPAEATFLHNTQLKLVLNLSSAEVWKAELIGASLVTHNSATVQSGIDKFCPNVPADLLCSHTGYDFTSCFRLVAKYKKYCTKVWPAKSRVIWPPFNIESPHFTLSIGTQDMTSSATSGRHFSKLEKRPKCCLRRLSVEFYWRCILPAPPIGGLLVLFDANNSMASRSFWLLYKLHSMVLWHLVCIDFCLQTLFACWHISQKSSLPIRLPPNLGQFSVYFPSNPLFLNVSRSEERAGGRDGNAFGAS